MASFRKPLAQIQYKIYVYPTNLSGGAFVVARQLLVVGGPKVVSDLVGGNQVRLGGQDRPTPVLQRGQARVEVASIDKK